MSSPASSDLVDISPPSSHDMLPDTSADADADIDSKDALVRHIEQAGTVDVDIKPVAPAHLPSPAVSPVFKKDVKQGNARRDETRAKQVKKEVPSTEEDARLRMEETVQNIRDKADRLQAAAQPYAEKTRSFAESQPVFFTFLVLFGLFSAVPILCFGTFLLGATLFVLSVAAIAICTTLFFSIILSASILIPVLFVTFLLATSTLSFLLFLFLAHRLYLHVSAACTVDAPSASFNADDNSTVHGEDDNAGGDDDQSRTTRREFSYDRIASGILSWTDETKARILPARYVVVTPASNRGDEQETKDGEEGSEVTLVGELKDVKVETPTPGEKGTKKVRWSFSDGLTGPNGNEGGATGST